MHYLGWKWWIEFFLFYWCSVQEDTIPVFEDQSPRKHQLVDEGIAEEINPPDLPSPEFQRDANHGSDFNYNPILSDWVDADLEIVNQISKDIETHTPHTEKPEEPSKSQKHQASHSYNHSESNMPFGKCKFNVIRNWFTLN